MKKNIGRALLVDDQSCDITHPYHLFHHIGYDVTLAFDGEQALAEVAHGTFDLIVLDWNMPFSNGGDFLRRYENRARLGAATPSPIILHTGESLLMEESLGMREFVVDIWQKPIGALEMLNRLKKLGIAG